MATYKLSLPADEINSVLSGATTKAASAVTGNIPVFSAGRDLSDSGRSPDSYALALVTTDGPDSILSVYPDAGSAVKPVSSITAVQSGEGTPSPSNVRALAGWSSINLWHGGKNLIDLSGVASKTIDGVTFAVGDDGTVTVSGEYTGNTYVTLDLKNLYLPSDVDLSVSGCPTGGSTSTYYITLIVYGNDTPVTYVNDIGSGKTANLTNVRLIQPKIVIQKGTDLTTPLVFRPMVTHINNAVAFEPYNNAAQTVTVSLGQTVYGGSFDWSTGTLSVTSFYRALNGEEQWFSLNDDRYPGAMYISFSGIRFIKSAITCSHAVNNQSSAPGGLYTFDGDYRVFVNPTGGQWGDILSGWTDETLVGRWKAWLKNQSDAGTPVQMMVTRQEPITVQLSAHTIAAIQGQNCMYSNTGHTSATYNKSIAKALEELSAAVIALGAGR